MQLGVGETLCGQIGQHLMPEQMWVDRLRQARADPIGLHDLLNAAGRERAATRRLEEILVFGMSLQMALQDEPEAGGEQDVAILGSLALSNEDAAVL